MNSETVRDWQELPGSADPPGSTVIPTMGGDQVIAAGIVEAWDDPAPEPATSGRRLTQNLRNTVETALRYYDAAIKAVSRQAEMVTQRYQEEPSSVVGIAIGIGFVIGLVLSSGRRGKTKVQLDL